MTSVTDFAHSISDTTRWRILLLLFDEPMCVCEIADILGMPQSSVSSHVQVLRKAGLLDGEKCEKRVYYRAGETYRPLLRSMEEFLGVAPDTAKAIRLDGVLAQKRLAERRDSCCPLPTALLKLKPLTLRKFSKPTRK